MQKTTIMSMTPMVGMPTLLGLTALAFLGLLGLIQRSVSGSFLLLIISLSVAALWLSVASPRLFLAGLVVARIALDYISEYWTIELQRNFSINLSQGIGALLFVIGVVFVLSKWRALPSFSFQYPLLVVLAYAVVTLGYTVSTVETAKEILRLADLFFIFIIAYVAAREEGGMRWILGTVMLSALIPLGVGLWQYIAGVGIREDFAFARVYATFTHANVFGLYLVLVLSAVFLYLNMYAKTRKAQILAVGFAVIGIVLFLLSFSRVSWGVLFVLFLVLGIVRFPRFLPWVIALPLLLMVAFPLVRSRVGEVLHPLPTSSITWRIEHWNDLIRYTIAQDAWRWGFGVNTAPIVSEHLREDDLGSNDPHNDFVKFFVEGGIAGLLVYLIYLGGVAFLLWKQLRQSGEESGRTAALTMLLLFLALALAGVSENIIKITPVQWILWMLIGGALGASGIKKATGTEVATTVPV